MAGPDLRLGWQREQLVVDRVEDPACALRFLDGQIRAGDVADEERVAAEDGPGVAVAAPRVRERERRVLRAVSRRVKSLDTHGAQLQLPAVVERLVLVVRLRIAVDVDRRAGRGCEPAVA